MPELPEVESVRTGLEKLIKGLKIKQVTVLWDRIIAEPSDIRLFKEKIKNQRIESIGRRGKFLLFFLTDYVMISHLRMEGKYRIESTDVPISKHTHVIFELEDGRELRYLDVRKFGRISLIPRDTELAHASIAKLGPEPVRETLVLETFKIQLLKRKKTIKATLLDQTVIAGIGNIYADEILFEAKIHPARMANTLTEREIVTLYEAILLVMGKAVKAGGTTIRTYQNAFGETGSYQSFLNVYGKNGQPCPRCETTIEKTKVAQRGTHYCPNCQSDIQLVR
ncbi:DNA-formamidopyrimidine glycosylase [Marinilactibacillus sp. Marseille-P9653]|uniref:DNA-formamidopyrimidine glycosylase n=1 Tax=Marinilactibacillus sp. Marseille-P9653 TaxID=2866583 RepID=UPI001CE3F9C4|nr:DNA-formamidopyrimidine glycosylase [Marinilactibacillus sp. Marseille-P9653]